MEHRIGICIHADFTSKHMVKAKGIYKAQCCHAIRFSGNVEYNNDLFVSFTPWSKQIWPPQLPGQVLKLKADTGRHL